MHKFLLIDGHNLLFQMFYGMPSRIINQKGQQIQGIVGLIGALFKMIRQIHPTHILLVFDGEHENQRKNISSDYKSNRIDYSLVSDVDSPFAQLPLIYKVLDYLKIPYIETKIYEADDLIANYVNQYNDIEIVISSYDSDFFSLINEHVKIFRYRGKSSYFIDSAFIKNKLNIQPKQYTLFKSLIGDCADNIKGIYGIGPKTAANLISNYSTLEEFLNNTDKIKNEKFKTKVKDNIDLLQMNYSLIQFQHISKLPFCMNELVYKLDENITSTQVLHATSIW
ncbi:MAG: hypothetical protein K2I42_04440 [Anaeroplasmataceae bacterium]|nr:hypothetical protein [Anaeroplasmataceae bacterium]